MTAWITYKLYGLWRTVKTELGRRVRGEAL